VALRYFGGLPLEEFGEAFAVSLGTVGRDLAWLRRTLSGGAD